ncbi:MAG: GYD domain-containing protein [Thermomicrobiales bacterium]
MPLFMIQATYTAEAWAKLIRQPEDRRQAIGALVEQAGGRLHELYYAFGENDIVFIFEAADELAAAAISVAGNAAGHIKQIKTTRLLTVEDSLELMRRAAALGPAKSPTG